MHRSTLSWIKQTGHIGENSVESLIGKLFLGAWDASAFMTPAFIAAASFSQSCHSHFLQDKRVKARVHTERVPAPHPSCLSAQYAQATHDVLFLASSAKESRMQEQNRRSRLF